MTESEYKRALRDLRADIIESQTALRNAKTPVLLIITGFDGAGKGQVINLLSEWLDPRGVSTHAFWTATEEERRRPYFWRYWRALPPRSRIGLLFGSYYGDVIAEKTFDVLSTLEFEKRIERIRFFERMLVRDGALIAKFWLHLSEAEQAARMDEIEENPQFHWRMQSDDWKEPGRYDSFWIASQQTLQATDQPGAPWISIDATCPLERNLAVARNLVTLFNEFSKTVSEPKKTKPRTSLKQSENAKAVQLPKSPEKMSSEDYNAQLETYQEKLRKLAWAANEKRVSSVLVFEGWDAAGKGGCIRRIIHALDARLYEVIPISAPTDEEFAHHYLWRFWTRLPLDGRITIYDRSWYGRVLVERVEGFANEDEWSRAYQEINEFESQLVDHGVALVKFWLQITKETQQKRFDRRMETAHKRYKISSEDWRNRARWDEYEVCLKDMLAKTDTAAAPWTVIPANDKKHARIATLKTYCEALEQRIDTKA